MATYSSTVPNFFENKAVFLTGATGFCGKAILEKLLRGCPEISKVYVLVRSQKGKSGEERIEEILQAPIFELVREKHPDSLKKVIPVNGDVAYPELGLSPEDAAMLREDVSVVIHSAAVVNFGASMKTVLQINVRGVKNMLDWAKTLKHLQAYVHISTAYSNSDRLKIEEKVYPNKVSPHAAMRLCSELPEDILNSITPILLGKSMIPYAFSKHLGEILVEEYREFFPISIVRPAIVTAANKEPIPGCIDSTTGFNGVIEAISKGLIHCVRINNRGMLDLVPVDHVANLTIAAAMATGLNKSKDVMIYHCSSTENIFDFYKLFAVVVKAAARTPLSGSVWYPFIVYTKSRFIVNILDYLLHYIPCVLVDVAFKFARTKPKYGMVQTYNRLKKLFASTEEIMATDFEPSTKNTVALFKQLAPSDQESFDFDISALKHEQFILQSIAGGRRYAVKEDDSTIPKAQKRFKRLQMLHYGSMAFLVILAALIIKFLLFS